MNPTLWGKLIALVLWTPMAMLFGYIWHVVISSSASYIFDLAFLIAGYLTVIFLALVTRRLSTAVVGSLFLQRWKQPATGNPFVALAAWVSQVSRLVRRSEILAVGKLGYATDPYEILLGAFIESDCRRFAPEELLGLAKLQQRVGKRPVLDTLRAIYRHAPREAERSAWVAVHRSLPAYANSFRSKQGLILMADDNSIEMDPAALSEEIGIILEAEET